MQSPLLRSSWLLLPLTVAACGGNPEINNTGGSTTTTTDTGGTGGSGADGGGGGDGGMLVGGSGGGTMTTNTSDPCDGVPCGPDQHCEAKDGQGTCVNNTCDMLNCGPTEVCDLGPNGGYLCKDISCSTDLQCPMNQFCDGTICVDDVCSAGAAECMGDDVLVCLANGSGKELKFTCGSERTRNCWRKQLYRSTTPTVRPA